MNVPEQELPSPEEFWQTIYPRQQPVVFRGVGQRWHILQAPSSSHDYALLDLLTRIVGDRLIDFGIGMPLDGGFMHYADLEDGVSNNMALTRRRFSQFAHELKREVDHPTGHHVYAYSAAVASELPELLPMLDVPVLRDRTLNGGHWRLWISSGGHMTGTHFDSFQNLVFVAHGIKRYRVFPPSQLPNMYPGPFDQGPFRPTESMVNPRRPDLERYPRYARALETAADVELQAGDVLFLPAHWWHAVETPGVSIAANYWWGHTDRARQLARTVLLSGLLHLRPLPETHRRFWRQVLDYYVFQTEGQPHVPIAPTALHNSAHRPAAPAAVAPSDLLRIAPAVAVGVSADALQLAVAGRPVTRMAKAELDVLLQFHTAARPQDVVDALSRSGYDVQLEQVMTSVRQLCRIGGLMLAVRHGSDVA